MVFGADKLTPVKEYHLRAGVTTHIKARSPEQAEAFVRQLLGSDFKVLLVQVED